MKSMLGRVIVLMVLCLARPSPAPAAHRVADVHPRAPLLRDVVLVVEDTGELSQNVVDGRPQPLTNLKAGLTVLAAAVAVDSPSRVGLVRYGCTAVVDVPLESGSAHVERWRQRVGGMAGDQTGGAEIHLAIRRALAELAPHIGAGASSSGGVIVIVDAGGIPCHGLPPFAGAEDRAACAAAHDVGVTVAVVALRKSQGRMEACSSPGWFFRSGDENGTDVPAMLDALRERLMPALMARLFVPAVVRAR